MPEIRVMVEDGDNNRLTIEAGSLGVTKAGFFRLLFKSWLGEVRLERKPDSDGASNNNPKNQS